MTAFETALIAAVRAAVSDPEADAYWRDGSSGWRGGAGEVSYALSYVSRTRRGKDHRTLGAVVDGSAPETITGNRVAIVQVAIDAGSQDAAIELADVLAAGLTSSECDALFWAVNASAARPAQSSIRSVPYRDSHGDTRSAAVLEIAFNLTRSVTVGAVPILASAEITGEVEPGPVTVGPVLVEV